MHNVIRNFKKNKELLFMVLPVTVWLILVSYLPMFGIVIAFKDYKIHKNGFLYSLIYSKWVGLKNFEYLFKTDAWLITRNTILYNIVFIVTGLIFSVTFAILLCEVANRRLAKFYQTTMFLPHFLSWVVVGYFFYGFLSIDKGFFNQILKIMGKEPVLWYSDPSPWPFILIFMNLWKGTGYGSVVYMAAIMGIDKTYYEAAMLDGASKWQQIKHITLPMLKPVMIILTVLALGRIFNSDFGLFYQVPRDSGALYDVTNVIDTFVFRGLRTFSNIGMTAAAGFYQSIMGFLLVLISNYIINKIDSENALF